MKITFITILVFLCSIAIAQSGCNGTPKSKTNNMDELKVSKAVALSVYNSTDSAGKELICLLLGKRHFLTDPRDSIKTFDDACRDQGVVWNADDYKGWTPDEIAYRKMKIIVAALNGDWVANWDDPNQKKWYPWFQWTPSGFRFNDTTYVNSLADAGSGSRLRLCSEEMARYFGTQFIDIINDYLN